MTDKSDIIEMLENLANRQCWSDDENLIVHEYCGGNVDDAYSKGCDDGETFLARRLIELLK